MKAVVCTERNAATQIPSKTKYEKFGRILFGNPEGNTDALIGI
jgi:hypothetical protein